MNSHQRRKARRKGITQFKEPPKLIRNWEELAQVPDSETHRLDIDVNNGCGWCYAKDKSETFGCYLSTHTFYGSTHERSTQNLRKRGFNVTIDNWDK